MKLPADKKLITDPDGKPRIVPRENPKLSTSKKLQQRKSKKQRPVSPGKAGLKG